MKFARFLAAFGWVLFACAALAQMPSADNAALLKADADFNAATQAKGLDGWMAFMSEDIVLFRGLNVIGRDAIRAELAPEWADPKHRLEWKPTGARMEPGGRIGYTWGTWSGTFGDFHGGSFSLTGEYLTVWQKQKDGSWKVLWYGGGANPPKK